MSLEALATGFQPVTGPAVTIRPLGAGDAGIEEAFIRGLSPATRSDRLLGGARAITPEYIARLTRVDYPRELALAAVVAPAGRETLVGVARYALEAAGDSCEFAVVVADAWQGRGLGRRLTQALIAAARAHGLRQMKGYVLSANHRMLQFARKLGFSARRVPGDATVTEVTLELSLPH